MEFKVSKLDNGLTVATDYAPHYRGVAVEWALQAGSRHEGFPGAAHFFEHLFASSLTADNQDETMRWLSKKSLSRNFFTDYERISAYAHTVPEYAAQVIETLGKSISAPAWNGEIFERERQRIMMELREAQDNSYDQCMVESLVKGYAGHPVAHEILGAEDNILNMQPSSLSAYQREHFHAQRMGLVVSGSLPHEEVLEMANAAFGSLPKGEQRPVQDQPLFQPQQRLVLSRKEGNQTSLLHFDSVHRAHPLSAATRTMMQLYQTEVSDVLRKNGRIYSDPSAHYVGYSDFGYITVAATSEKDRAFELLEEAALLTHRPEQWLTRERFEESRMRDKMFDAFNSVDPRNRSGSIINHFMSSGIMSSYEDGKAGRKNVSFDDVMSACDNWNRDQFNIVSCGPGQDIPHPEDLKRVLPQRQGGKNEKRREPT